MSVLIKGMNIPENCLMCPFHGFGDYKGESIVCALTGRSEGQLSNVLGCPLVEVPTPHGRLVDADALKATFCAECNHTITCEDCDIDYHIGRLASTIIEAEEGEGHETD